MENEEIDFDEFDKFDKDLDSMSSELDHLFEGLDKLYNLLDLAEELKPKLHETENNLNEINVLVEFIKNEATDKNQCCAAVYCSILSIFECFIHELLLILNKYESSKDEDSFVHKANSLNNDRGKEFSTANQVVEHFSKITLNNPNKVILLCNRLFDFNIEDLDIDGGQIIKYRNAYTHRGGYDKERKLSLSAKDVCDLYQRLYKLVVEIKENVISYLDNHLDRISQNYGVDNKEEKNK